MRVVDDLPFVPTTWMLAKRRCGMPSTVMSLCMRSSPNRMPNSSRSSRYASASRRVTRRVYVGDSARNRQARRARTRCGSVRIAGGQRHGSRGRSGTAMRGAVRARSRRLLAPEVQRDPDSDPREQREAPDDALTKLCGHGARADVGDGPPDSEDRGAHEVPPLRLGDGPPHRLAGEERAQSEAAHHAEADEADANRDREHLPHVRLLEEQHPPDLVGVDEVRPRQDEAEAAPEENAGEPYPVHVTA